MQRKGASRRGGRADELRQLSTYTATFYIHNNQTEEDTKERSAEALALEKGKGELLHFFPLLLLFIHLVLLILGLLQEITFNDSGNTKTTGGVDVDVDNRQLQRRRQWDE